ERSITRPPSHTAVPATLWPPPRTATSRSRSRAKRTAVRTSTAPVQRAMSPGRRSIAPFQIARAASYCVSPGRMSSPRKCCARSVRAASSRAVAVSMRHLLVDRQHGSRRPRRKVQRLELRRSPPFTTLGSVMKGYGQFCPVAKAAEIVAERWTPLVLRELLCGSRRFSDLHRGVPLMSPTLLAGRLEQLEDAGIVRSVAKP